MTAALKATLLRSAVIAAAISSFGVGGPATAASLTNGGFETGDFSGWSAIGPTSVVTGAFGTGPTEGTYQALMDNSSGSSSDASIESFLGISAGSLDGISSGDATQGSAIKSVFDVNAGDTISFDWNFLTNEVTPSSFNDFSFVSITVDGVVQVLADTTASGFSSSGTTYNEETGFNSFSYTLGTAGTLTLGLGVMDVKDSSFNSALLVDNVTVSPVPLPAAAPLFVGSLALLGFVGNRTRRKT